MLEAAKVPFEMFWQQTDTARQSIQVEVPPPCETVARELWCFLFCSLALFIIRYHRFKGLCILKNQNTLPIFMKILCYFLLISFVAWLGDFTSYGSAIVLAGALHAAGAHF